MPWINLQLETSAKDCETVSAWLEVLGAVSITLQDAADQGVFEPAPDSTPLWECVTLQALFDINTDPAPIVEQLQQLPIELRHCVVTTLGDEVWERKWLAHAKPLQFGKRLWVYPGDCPGVDDTQECYVRLDPGLAFGTGTHPTTQLCLEWLDANIQGGENIIDYGCGSGILAIAALKLGARHALAIDYDPQALYATQDNAVRNGISAEQLSTQDNQQTITQRSDVLLANILAKPLQDLAPTFATLLKPQGWLVLSGILSTQLSAVVASYEPYFSVQSVQCNQEWLRIDAQRNH